jgi:hypothetical protein
MRAGVAGSRAFLGQLQAQFLRGAALHVKSRLGGPEDDLFGAGSRRPWADKVEAVGGRTVTSATAMAGVGVLRASVRG